MIKLNDPLIADDIEVRIGTANQGGFSLLLYKTARTDVKRLDLVHPEKWKNRYFHDQNGLLCCEISVYNDVLKEWVSRVDVGTESFTEKEKGSYSDAFKRAGFKWNIGTELYSAPFIWISDYEMQQRSNKFTPKGFYPSNIVITAFNVKNGKVTGLELKDVNKGVIFSYGDTSNHKLFRSKAERIEYLAQISTAINEGELSVVAELLNELNREQQLDLWGEFGSQQQTAIRQALEEAKQ